MIKMIIGGEEVVSNKEFTINEEMLSASSTILNNCYPKSWEDNKDYTSNFYYPKDYSKFLLGEGEFLHGLDEYSVLTVSGSNPFYETNVEKEWNSFNVYGNTYQETRSGINLLNITATTTTLDGITYTVNKDKSITINGTNTKSSTSWFRLAPNFNLPAGTYTLSNGNSNVTYSTFIFYDDKGNIPASGNVSSKTFTSSIEVAPYIRIGGGQTINNQTIYPMIVEGSYTVQTLPTYEQYGLMPSPDYPSELVSVGYKNLLENAATTQTINGITFTKNYDGTIVANGTANGTVFYKIYEGTIVSTGLYFTNIQNTVNNLSSYVANENDQRYTEYGNGVFIPSGYTIKYVYIRVSSGVSLSNAIFKPMIEKGTQAHSYIPYGKYGIEIKNTGKNLLPLENINFTTYGVNFKTENGTLIINGTSTGEIFSSNNNFRAYFKLNLSAGTYYLSYNSSLPNIYPTIKNYSDNSNIRENKGSFTLNENTTVYLGFYIYNKTFSNLDTKVMIEKGTQATPYEEYKTNSQLYILDEPLRAIGQYQDKLYVNNGVLFVERKIGSIVLNGSEVGWSNQGGQAPYSLIVDNLKRINSQVMVKSSNFMGVSYNSNWTIYNALVSTSTASSSIKLIKFKYVDMATLDNFKSWLSTHNTEVQYVLDEPTITPIGYVNMPNAYEGQNTTYLYTGLETTMDVLYYWKNFNVLFAGVVKNTGDISLNPRYPHYCNLQILDYKTFLSESNTLDFVIANKTVKEAIGMVVNAISGYGFILGEINIDSADDIIGAYSTLNKTAYDVLQYLANISGSRWRARYVDSSTMAIDFYDPDTLPQGANIEYTQEYWENNNIVDLTFNYGTRDYRNKQILLSDEVYANINYNETLISNGYTNTFTLQNNIGTVVNILVGNEEKTVATTNDKQMGIDADFYYAPGKNIIESNSVYSAGTLIKITYQPLVKGRQIVYNTNEVDRISTQTDTEGIIARYENRNDILSSDELEKIAQTYIEYKGKAEVILTLTTRNNDLYNIGEVVYFDAPIPDLAQNYMVKTKKTEYIVIDEIVNLFYIYEMTSSFNSEKAINYFDNQRNKASGNIAEGDSITRNIDIETDVAIIWTGGTVSSASITVDGDNVLNSVLNSPFVE